MNNPQPSDPQPGPFRPDEADDATPDSLPSEGSRSNRRRRVVEMLGGAALLSTTALLPLIDPKIPPFRAD